MPKTALAKIIGERLRMIRKKQGLSQEELAHLSNTHPTYIGQLERGEKNVTVDTLDKVTNALNISLEELFRFSSINPKSVDESILQLNNLLVEVNNEDRQTILKIIHIMLEWKTDTTKRIN
ncbi:helix-turn-helix domain-containing protein [Aquibacillus salsiterrae]|uniref:Helix-turn-helix domain-containing protein n=1 Tax=Aquibacillus salsiterrae TaxID=2950439 RepID=A0A9X3WJE4_9BACI|nr:helix-turn-helix transcriptional regulator [Aquibacillus salsiterrae]MDC3418514.1 helix-turn-helix domain-containing protein [Aquibacillus salsiterrae]